MKRTNKESETERRKFFFSFCFAFSFLFLLSCANHHSIPAPVTTPTGSLVLQFTNFAGADSLKLNTAYTNSSGETFTPTAFNYYISNIKLYSASGTLLWSEPQSYHLLQQGDLSTLKFTLNAPVGEYGKISFMLGVDSLRNVSGAQTGALDPLNGMFWTWNSGYIMLKLEGTSPVSPAVNNIIEYHTGGFSGPNSVLKTLTFDLPATINIREDQVSEVHWNTNMLQLFTQPQEISIATMPAVNMPGVNARKVADNYEDMFTIDLVENN